MIRMLLIICCFYSVQQDEPVLPWSDSYKVSWKDFKGTPKLNESAVAITASGIAFEFSIRETEDEQVVSFTSNVEALFYPEKSWFKPNHADDHILGHEQLHFDITELFASKLRQRISKLNKSNHLSKDLKAAHESVLKELAGFQDTYDNETGFSRKKSSQAEWEVSVQSKLIELAKYKSVN